MNKYEAMFIVKPDLAEEEKKSLFNQIGEAVLKQNGEVASSNIWSEKRRLYFSIKRYRDGIYYLMHFNADPKVIKDLRQTFRLNENILRVLITKAGS